MSSIGSGVREIRIRDEAGAFRVIYIAKLVEAVYVLHCLQTLSRIAEGSDEMTSERFESIWDAIEDNPAQSENLKLRSAMMMALKSYIKRQGLSQAEAATLLGVTQPRVSDLAQADRAGTVCPRCPAASDGTTSRPAS